MRNLLVTILERNGHADPFAFPFPTKSKPTATHWKDCCEEAASRLEKFVPSLRIDYPITGLVLLLMTWQISGPCYDSDIEPDQYKSFVWKSHVLEIIASLWRENSSRDLKTELCTRVLELCSRSESWSWSSVWIECRSSNFYANWCRWIL